MALILIVGAGRVGSQVARSMLSAGHEVSILDDQNRVWTQFSDFTQTPARMAAVRE